MRWTAFPKINWSLSVTGRRANGYHTLDMLMQTVHLPGLYDTLTFQAAPVLSLSVHGDSAVPADDRNIVLRAARLLQDASGRIQGARIGLVKGIPSGAGLGGGSADAATAIRGLCALWNLRLPRQTLHSLALQLGADVPFFLQGGLARVRGIGERIEPLGAGGSPRMLIAQPTQELSTPAVFAQYDRMRTPPDNPDVDRVQRLLCSGDLRRLAEALGNALTAPAIALCPAVGQCIEGMRANGALGVCMSGSGSSVFGLFDHPQALYNAANALRQAGMQCWGTGFGSQKE